jgi:hypothetical protein
MPLERLDPPDGGQLGPVQRPARHDHKACLEDITAVGRHRPVPGRLVPARRFNLRLEAGLLIEMEVVLSW